MRITWLGHSSFRIETMGKVIYIDPYAGDDYSVKADIILVTHGHYDHSNKEKIELIRTDDTEVFTAKDNSAEIEGIAMSPLEERSSGDITIRAMAAYNIGKEFHQHRDGGLGFMILSEGKSLYHAGDTDLIPEMDGLGAEIALLPVGGTYTMDAQSAALAAARIGAKHAIPMHFGNIVGNIDDAEYFSELLMSNSEIAVHILKEGESIEL